MRSGKNNFDVKEVSILESNGLFGLDEIVTEDAVSQADCWLRGLVTVNAVP